MSSSGTIDYNRLNGLLWRYRPYLERFEFLLEVQLWVSSSGRRDWQLEMAELFDETVAVLNELDLEREVLLAGGPGLRELATQAGEPWSDILLEQHAELEATIARITKLRQRNEQALREGAAGLHQLIDALAEANGSASDRSGVSYGQDGRLQHGGGSAVLFDGRV
jgi:hypothetical protein